jgi:hypothetical protein
MKKNYWLLLLLILVVFSCKGTPKSDQGADDPGLSGPELTGFDDGSLSDEDILAWDGSEVAEDVSAETDDLADAEVEVEEQPLVEAVVEEEKPKETPPPPVLPPVPPAPPQVTAVQPPITVIEEQPAQEEAASEESKPEQIPPPRVQQLLTPPPAVTAIRDDAPVPNQRLLVPPKEEEIVFSRIVRVTAGQIIEIPFRGNNWSYLEDRASRRGIIYDSRRNDPEGQTFIFKTEEAGTYTLRFSKHDVIRDYILNDYVQVVVSESAKSSGPGWFNPPTDRVRVTAEPRWPSALDEAAILRGDQVARPGTVTESAPARTQGAAQSSTANRETSQTQGAGSGPSTAPVVVIIPPIQGTGAVQSSPMIETTVQPTPQGTAPQIQPTITPPPQNTPIPQAVPETPAVEKQEKLPPEEILKKAQDAFDGKNISAALALLDQYLEYYPEGDDELYWLYGQFYEANTPSRNILLSLDYYRRLINEYPQSRRYNDARRRIAYLERFYINIQ